MGWGERLFESNWEEEEWALIRGWALINFFLPLGWALIRINTVSLLNYNFSKMANYGNGYKILSDGKLK